MNTWKGHKLFFTPNSTQASLKVELVVVKALAKKHKGGAEQRLHNKQTLDYCLSFKERRMIERRNFAVNQARSETNLNKQ